MPTHLLVVPSVEPPELREIRVELLRTDGDTQARVATDEDVVREYAEAMDAGALFPPVRVCFDGGSYWLTDGFHRLAAAKALGCQTIPSECFAGSLEEARWDSLGANATHGIRRTPEDTRLVVTRALAHPNAATRSNYEIARHCGVSEKTIRRARPASTANAVDSRLVRRNGKEFPMAFGNIGKTNGAHGAHKGSTDGHARLDRRLLADLLAMEASARPEARRILNILKKWIRQAAGPREVLRAMEAVLVDLSGSGPH